MEQRGKYLAGLIGEVLLGELGSGREDLADGIAHCCSLGTDARLVVYNDQGEERSWRQWESGGIIYTTPGHGCRVSSIANLCSDQKGMPSAIADSAGNRQ